MIGIVRQDTHEMVIRIKARKQASGKGNSINQGREKDEHKVVGTEVRQLYLCCINSDRLDQVGEGYKTRPKSWKNSIMKIYLSWHLGSQILSPVQQHFFIQEAERQLSKSKPWVVRMLRTSDQVREKAEAVTSWSRKSAASL